MAVALAVVFAVSSTVMARGYGRSGECCAGPAFEGQEVRGPGFGGPDFDCPRFEGRGFGGPGLALIMGLDLSDSQRDQALKILETYQIDRIKDRGAFIKEHENLRKALQVDTVNEQEIRAAFKKVASMQEDRLVARAKVMNEIKSILTPEQVKLLDERTKKRPDCNQERRGHDRPFADRRGGGCPRW